MGTDGLRLIGPQTGSMIGMKAWIIFSASANTADTWSYKSLSFEHSFAKAIITTNGSVRDEANRLIVIVAYPYTELTIL